MCLMAKIHVNKLHLGMSDRAVGCHSRLMDQQYL